MRQTNTRSTVEAGIMSAIAIVFAFISAYVPVLGVFVNLIWPVPIILLGIRHGFRWSVMATVVSGVIIAIVMHPLQAVSIVVGFGLIGIVLGYAFRAGFGPFKTIMWGSAASLVSKVAILAIGIVIMGVNPLNIQGEAMDKAMLQVVDVYRGFGIAEDKLAEIQQQMQDFIKLFQIILPAGFVMAAVFDTFLNFVVARAVLRKLGQYIAPFPPFKEWTLPRPVLYAFILSIAMMYFGKVQQLDPLFKVGANLQIVGTILLLGQGLALFYFLADKYNLSRFVRAIILLLIITNGLFTQFAVFAGAFDVAIDYRRLRQPRSS